MIRITFFGDFTVSQNDKILSVKDSAAYRLYRALAYLVKYRNRRVDALDFARFLHDDKPLPKANDSLVKVTLHRLRELLSAIADGETIIAKDGGIWFSPTLTFSADTERFEDILAAYENASPERRRFLFEEAIALYKGRYLASFFGESFTMPEAERYHRSFIALCENEFAVMIDQGEYENVIALSQKLTSLDVYSECFHYYRIYALLLSGDKALASSLYHNVWHLFQREFHITPSSRFSHLKAYLTPSMSIPAKTVDEALTLLSRAAAKRQDPALIQDPVAFFATLRTVDHGNLLLIEGDTKKVQPLLLEIFDEKSLVTPLNDEVLFLLCTLDDAAFIKRYDKLKTIIDRTMIKATLERKKYPADMQ